MITFRQILSAAGLEPRSYSGRGMYGKNCVGVTTDDNKNEGAIFASVLIAIGELPGNEKSEALDICAEAFARMAIDSMGMGTILYFPNRKWED